ncbi:allatostatin-A receptor-like [Dromiciops gliroides]|uniref:allatostatin-A receptor-like n=1 Tax=Dromiciops gliroides TaxID=33562 RepID=UPI001CC38933|nr:allatostatin-A receptor-like [Dromiciops gliroides]
MNDNHYSLPESRLRPVFATLCGLILLVGLLANGLMLIILGRGSGSRGQAPGPLLALTNSLMVNITLSDLVFLVYVVPVLLLTFLQEDWWLGPSVCTTSQSFNMGTMFCTFYSMVATALLRHAAVAFPAVAFPAGRGAQLLLCLTMWILGFSVSLPNWLYQKVVEEVKEVGEEAAVGTESKLIHSCLMLLGPAQTSCYFTLLGALAFLPFALMLVLSFTHLGWLLWSGEWLQVPRDVRQHREATGLILVVLVVFVLMWGPCSVLGYVAASGDLPDTFTVFVATSLCTILAYSNCAVSPILCFCLSRQFQAGLKDLFCCSTQERAVLRHGGMVQDVQGGESGRVGAPGSLWGTPA